MRKVYQFMETIFKDIPLFNEIPKGKGIRAKIITFIAPEAIPLAAAVETIHLASLLHDDVIDGATLRRGVESINSKYDNKTAIMLGDILFSKGLEFLIEFDKDSAKSLANVIFLLSQGEMEDVELSKKMNLDKDKYINMIYKKTASLIEMGCREASRIAGLDSEKYAKYGKNLGLVFQIVDDILDIVSDEKTLGKPVMNDLYEGKMTLPFIYMYNQLNENDKNYFKTLFKKRLNRKEEDWIKSKIKPFIKICYQEAVQLAEEGIEGIEEKFLRDLMMKLIEREF